MKCLSETVHIICINLLPRILLSRNNSIHMFFNALHIHGAVVHAKKESCDKQPIAVNVLIKCKNYADINHPILPVVDST